MTNYFWKSLRKNLRKNLGKSFYKPLLFPIAIALLTITLSPAVSAAAIAAPTVTDTAANTTPPATTTNTTENAPKNAPELRARYTAIAPQLKQNQFKRPLLLASSENGNQLEGDIDAVIDHPFSVVRAKLNNPSSWCEIMVLHINTKYCHAAGNTSGATLHVNIGKKTQEDLSTTNRLNLHYSVSAATSDYLEILLTSKEGPMGTSDYRIQLAAVSLPNNKTFLHLTYSYAVSFSGRVAMKTYLNTAGRGKVGFKATGKTPDGKPAYISGMRGLMERNTMRYYLAIDAFLQNPQPTQLEQRLQNYFTANERYARQLHEMNREEYIEMKRAEYQRQQSLGGRNNENGNGHESAGS